MAAVPTMAHAVQRWVSDREDESLLTLLTDRYSDVQAFAFTVGFDEVARRRAEGATVTCNGVFRELFGMLRKHSQFLSEGGFPWTAKTFATDMCQTFNEHVNATPKRKYVLTARPPPKKRTRTVVASAARVVVVVGGDDDIPISMQDFPFNVVTHPDAPRFLTDGEVSECPVWGTDDDGDDAHQACVAAECDSDDDNDGQEWVPLPAEVVVETLHCGASPVEAVDAVHFCYHSDDSA